MTAIAVAGLALGGGPGSAVAGAEVPDPLSGRFVKGTVAGALASRATTIDFGPDGRLYVGQQNGTVKAFTLAREGPGDYAVLASETIELLGDLPNHDDDGTLNKRYTARLLTGLVTAGTAGEPVVYAVTSDPRIGGGPEFRERFLDTNSGVLSRLVKEPGGWRRHDLVRGLPRSEENHHSNGLVLSGDTLYIAQGGMTNNGAPSNNFANIAEFALSGAILAVDLEALGDDTYDLPTLDDPARRGEEDTNDPFGGADGRNQARLVRNGPVTVHAPGFRNPYDLVVTRSGRMYTVDNGANGGWGGIPHKEGPEGRCTNEVHEGGGEQFDVLHLVTGAGYYGGHPNPTRGNRENTFAGQSPVKEANPIECDHRSGDDLEPLATFPASTNGLAEYTPANLGGALEGDLLAVSLDNKLRRAHLGDDGEAGVTADVTVLFDGVGDLPLDVVAAGADDPFPGTIWVGDFGAGRVVVFEPDDFSAP